jgi:hypothetical protein
VIRKPDSRDNLRSVHMTGQPLGVECLQCRHRAALAHDRIGAHAGNMKGVRELSFKCTACGSVANTLYMFHDQAEVDDFMASKPDW